MSDLAPDTKQLAVLKRLTDLLEAIRLPGSDTETFAERVYRGRTVFGKETNLPALSMLESTRPDLAPVVAGPNKIAQQTLWTILLQGYVADDKRNPTDPAYVLKGLCEQQLSRIIARVDGSPRPAYPDDYLLPLGGVKLITGITIGPGVVRPPDEISANAYFYLPLVIDLVINVSNPYAV